MGLSEAQPTPTRPSAKARSSIGTAVDLIFMTVTSGYYIFPGRLRAGSSAMIRRRSSSDKRAQAAISSMWRRQPTQYSWSSKVHTPMQGETGVSAACDKGMADAGWGWSRKTIITGRYYAANRPGHRMARCGWRHPRTSRGVDDESAE